MNTIKTFHFISFTNLTRSCNHLVQIFFAHKERFRIPIRYQSRQFLTLSKRFSRELNESFNKIFIETEKKHRTSFRIKNFVKVEMYSFEC